MLFSPTLTAALQSSQHDEEYTVYVYYTIPYHIISLPSLFLFGPLLSAAFAVIEYTFPTITAGAVHIYSQPTGSRSRQLDYLSVSLFFCRISIFRKFSLGHAGAFFSPGVCTLSITLIGQTPSNVYSIYTLDQMGCIGYFFVLLGGREWGLYYTLYSWMCSCQC